MRFYTFLSLLCFPLLAFPGVVPEKSRIIFNGKNTLQSSVLVNTNEYPVIVQLWVDDGEFNQKPEIIATPFVVTPVMSKMQPLKINEIKIIYSDEGMLIPKDRESLFWLNILEVPPVNKNTHSNNEVTLSMLTQIKLIYRPASLEINTYDLLEKFKSLRFTVKKITTDVAELTIDNPTEYIASLSAIKLLGKNEGEIIKFETTESNNITLLPKSSKIFTINDDKKLVNLQEVEFWLIDDQGNFVQKKQNIIKNMSY